MKLLDNPRGFKEIVINDNCDFDVFYVCAENLKRGLNIVYTNQIDDFDSIYWHFDFRGSGLTLHYNVFLGICIFPSKAKEASHRDTEVLIQVYELIKDKNFCENV